MPIKVCKKCVESKDTDDIFRNGYFPYIGSGNRCTMCDSELTIVDISADDYMDITKVSKDKAFIQAMIDLHDKDIIEYNLKMSQFRSSTAKSKPVDNSPKCPYCGSHDLKKISGASKIGSVALWGIFAAGKVSKQWHCNGCRSDF